MTGGKQQFLVKGKNAKSDAKTNKKKDKRRKWKNKKKACIYTEVLYKANQVRDLHVQPGGWASEWDWCGE